MSSFRLVGKSIEFGFTAPPFGLDSRFLARRCGRQAGPISAEAAAARGGGAAEGERHVRGPLHKLPNSSAFVRVVLLLVSLYNPHKNNALQKDTPTETDGSLFCPTRPLISSHLVGRRGEEVGGDEDSSARCSSRAPGIW